MVVKSIDLVFNEITSCSTSDEISVYSKCKH